MQICTRIFLLSICVSNALFCTQPVLIWDYDNTIVDQKAKDLTILPHVETAMKEGNPLNIICSGIRPLQKRSQVPKKHKPYDPHNDIEKFKRIMNLLPITAVVFSYAFGGTECWVMIKTKTSFEIRKAHEDNRYTHLKGLFQKPDTGMLQVIYDLLHEWHSTTDNILFIGDSVQDRQAAQGFCIPFLEVSLIHHKPQVKE